MKISWRRRRLLMTGSLGGGHSESFFMVVFISCVVWNGVAGQGSVWGDPGDKRIPTSNAIMESSHDDESEGDLKDALRVACYRDWMKIEVDRAKLAKYGVKEANQISLRDTSCLFLDRVSTETAFVLPTFFDKCSTLKTHRNGSLVFLNEILIRLPSPGSPSLARTSTRSGSPESSPDLPPSLNSPPPPTSAQENSAQLAVDFAQIQPSPSTKIISQRFYCISPPVSIPATKKGENRTLTPSLRFYKSESFDRRMDRFPAEIIVGSRIGAQLSPSERNSDKDIRIIPNLCYFSTTSDSKDNTAARYLLITNGCPHEGNGRVRFHHASSESRESRFSFEVERTFRVLFTFFHCHVAACSLKGGREAQGFPKCPSSRACSEQSIIRKSIPVLNPKTATVFVGPLRPVVKRRSTGPVASPTCKPCAETEASPEQENLVAPKVVVHGHSREFVALMSVSCFFLGVLLMAGIWWIYRRTDENRLYGSESGHRNSSGESAASSLHSAPNGAAPIQAKLRSTDLNRNNNNLLSSNVSEWMSNGNPGGLTTIPLHETYYGNALGPPFANGNGCHVVAQSSATKISPSQISPLSNSSITSDTSVEADRTLQPENSSISKSNKPVENEDNEGDSPVSARHLLSNHGRRRNSPADSITSVSNPDSGFQSDHIIPTDTTPLHSSCEPSEELPNCNGRDRSVASQPLSAL